MGEEVVPDAGREPLSHSLHIEGLEALQPKTHQHSRQQQQHQGAELF